MPKRIKDLTTTATTAANDDYIALDGVTNGTRKILPAGLTPDATTTAKGIVELATDGESAAGVVVQGNDTRLSNSRTPTAHQSTHAPGSTDALPWSTIHGRGTTAAKPAAAASNAGYLYFDTTLNKLQRSTGSTWEDVSEAGTVTSVAVSGGTTGLTTSGGPVTSSGTITLAGTLAVANGGTGATTAADARVALLPSLTGNGSKVLAVNSGATDVEFVTPPSAPTVQGPTDTNLLQNAANTFTITNFDSGTTYTLSTTNGTVTRSGATITYTPSAVGAGSFTINGKLVSGYTVVAAGQTAYTSSAGTFTFTVPANVTSICAVVVGGGGGGGSGYPNSTTGAGGGGGGLAWANNIAVTPGESLTVQVGAGGSGVLDDSYSNGVAGGETTISRGYTVLLRATGGAGGSAHGGSTSAGGAPSTGNQGGGTGGTGGSGQGSSPRGGGGGGAGGYTGNGGGGTIAGTTSASTAGAGGGASGGGYSMATDWRGGGGGGVGLLGQGASGTGVGALAGGIGGSGGADGTAGSTATGGGLYGGGGGGLTSSGSGSYYSGNGARGAARIIWGPGRAFPSTLTGNL